MPSPLEPVPGAAQPKSNVRKTLDTTVHDNEGREFADLSAAHRHAVRLIHKAVEHDDMDWRGWSINITDAHYRPMLSVLFPQDLD